MLPTPSSERFRRHGQYSRQRLEQEWKHRSKNRFGISSPTPTIHPRVATEVKERPKPARQYACCMAKYLKNHDNILAALTVLSMLLALTAGLLIRLLKPSEQSIELIGFLGELLMRLLKMLVQPLVVTSVISGLSSLSAASSKKMSAFMFVNCILTNWAAVMLGIVLVLCIHPGNPKLKIKIKIEKSESSQSVETLYRLLDQFRNLFPSNIVLAFFYQVETKFVKSEQHQEMNNSTGVQTSFDLAFANMPTTNVMGLIYVSIIIGLALRTMGSKAKLLIDLFDILNDVVMNMINVVIWFSPLGIFSFFTGNILKIGSLANTFQEMGPFILTVSLGFTLHMLLVQALSYLVLTRRNPLTFFSGALQAWLTALGTSSSTATLPITIRCLNFSLGVDKRITRFVLPIGATVNMNGTSLYMIVSVIFIAQINDVPIDASLILMASLLTMVATIGAPGLPGGAPVATTTVVSALGLPTELMVLIHSVDWLLDIQCTAVNILGDVYCAGILDGYSRQPISSPSATPGSLFEETTEIEDSTPEEGDLDGNITIVC